MDITALRPSEDYARLRRHYVIYICTLDLIGKGGYKYEPIIPWFEGYPDVRFDDDRRTIFFNTKGNRGELTEGMREILKYMDDPKTYPVTETKVTLIKQIDAAVRFDQQSPEWRRNYEVLSMREMDAAIDAMEEGLELSAIVSKLLSKGKSPSEISREENIPIDTVLKIQKKFDEV
ncbi:hypothetical protein AGMMS49992_12420 [Clostridia bacterium]|nr:hypothetical protein AGMMS49992_12420 [Clostridia bacterium]